MGIALPFIFIWEAVEKGLEGRNYKSRSRNPAWAASLFSGGVLRICATKKKAPDVPGLRRSNLEGRL
jgi:hypothetical protein